MQLETWKQKIKTTWMCVFIFNVTKKAERYQVGNPIISRRKWPLHILPLSPSSSRPFQPWGSCFLGLRSGTNIHSYGVGDAMGRGDKIAHFSVSRAVLMGERGRPFPLPTAVSWPTQLLFDMGPAQHSFVTCWNYRNKALSCSKTFLEYTSVLSPYYFSYHNKLLISVIHYKGMQH